MDPKEVVNTNLEMMRFIDLRRRAGAQISDDDLIFQYFQGIDSSENKNFLGWLAFAPRFVFIQLFGHMTGGEYGKEDIITFLWGVSILSAFTVLAIVLYL